MEARGRSIGGGKSGRRGGTNRTPPASRPLYRTLMDNDAAFSAAASTPATAGAALPRKFTATSFLPVGGAAGGGGGGMASDVEEDMMPQR